MMVIPLRSAFSLGSVVPDLGFVAEQDRLGDPFVNQNLGCTDNLFFFAFGKDDAFRTGLWPC